MRNTSWFKYTLALWALVLLLIQGCGGNSSQLTSIAPVTQPEAGAVAGAVPFLAKDGSCAGLEGYVLVEGGVCAATDPFSEVPDTTGFIYFSDPTVVSFDDFVIVRALADLPPNLRDATTIVTRANELYSSRPEGPYTVADLDPVPTASNTNYVDPGSTPPPDLADAVVVYAATFLPESLRTVANIVTTANALVPGINLTEETIVAIPGAGLPGGVAIAPVVENIAAGSFQVSVEVDSLAATEFQIQSANLVQLPQIFPGFTTFVADPASSLIQVSLTEVAIEGVTGDDCIVVHEPGQDPTVAMNVIARSEACQASLGFLTGEPAQSIAIDGGSQAALLTVGDSVNGSVAYSPIPDGIGCFLNAGDLICYTNHELAGVDTLDGGEDFLTSRVSRLVIDPETLAIQSLTQPVDGSEGYLRFCSSTWVDAAEGFPTGYYLTGEEVFNGTPLGAVAIALDDNGTVTELPWLGALSFENIFAVPYPGKIVVFSTDDAGGQSESYMYVGDSEADLINGTGQLYVMVSEDSAVDHSGDMTVGQTIEVSFAPVDATLPGVALADRWNEFQVVVDNANALPFVRLEDGDYDRRPGVTPTLYMVDTGRSSVTGRPEVGADCDGVCDQFGSIYKLVLDPTDPTANAQLTLVARSQSAAPGIWASPDNIGTSPNGIMMNEDPATSAFQREPGMWFFPFDGEGLGEPTEVVQLLDETCPQGQGCYESSGVLWATPFTGEEGCWIYDIQAHTLPEPRLNLAEDNGQLLYFCQPGT